MKKLLLTCAVLASLGIATPVTAADLPTDVATELNFMRQEEKLAHDVYLLLSGMYAGSEPGAKIFARIAESEQRHTDAIKALLDKYGVEDPAAALGPGEFTIDELTNLYTMLTNNGSAGLTEALEVGVVIEEADIDDIGFAIEISSDYADIVRVYSRLLTGSGHHLDAFLKVLDKEDLGDETSSAAGGASQPAPRAGSGKKGW